jgi:hypothetical protein
MTGLTFFELRLRTSFLQLGTNTSLNQNGAISKLGAFPCRVVRGSLAPHWLRMLLSRWVEALLRRR